MGDNTPRSKPGGSAKGTSDARASHQYNNKTLSEYIQKGMIKVQPFAEFLRMTRKTREHNVLLAHIVRLRDICSHKFANLTTFQLQAIASTMKYLDEYLGCELDSLAVHGQLPSKFYNQDELNADVMTAFIFRNGTVFPENAQLAWLKAVFPTIEADSLQDMTEKITLLDSVSPVGSRYNPHNDIVRASILEIADGEIALLQAQLSLFSKLK